MSSLDTFKFLSAVEIFLLSPDKTEVLLMHRSKDRKFLPGYYAGLGGKMDSEINETPFDTAIREIEEESGYKEFYIENLKLKAVFTAFDRYGKWMVFDFVGIVTKKLFNSKVKTDEGTLEWVQFQELNKLKLIPDLQYGTLQKIINSNDILWIKSNFDNNDKLINLYINNNPIVINI